MFLKGYVQLLELEIHCDDHLSLSDILLLTFWEYSVYVKKHFISSLPHFRPKM